MLPALLGFCKADAAEFSYKSPILFWVANRHFFLYSHRRETILKKG